MDQRIKEINKEENHTENVNEKPEKKEPEKKEPEKKKEPEEKEPEKKKEPEEKEPEEKEPEEKEPASKGVGHIKTGETEDGKGEEGRKPKAVRKGFFKKFRRIIAVIAALLILGIIFFISSAVRQAKDAAAAQKEQVFRDIERRDISNSIAVTANVEARDKRTVSTLVSNTKVLEVNYEVGDYVSEGDVICTFDTSSVAENMAVLQKKMNVTSEKNRIAVNDSVVNVNKAGTTWAYDTQDNLTSAARLQQDYDKAVADYYNAADGYSDAKKEKDKKKDEYESAKKDYESAQKEYNTLTDEEKAGAEALSGNKAKIRDKYTYYSGLYSSAEAAYKAASSAVDSYENNIKSHQTSVETARRNLEDAGIKTTRDYIKDDVELQLANEKSYIAGLDASIANYDNEKTMSEYEQLLDDSVVRAPISGVITSLNVHKGDEFAERTKTEVCVIQDDSSYLAKGTVDQYNISRVREGMKAYIKTQATGDDELEGIVSFVSPVPASASSSNTNGAAAPTGTSTGTSVSYPIEIRLGERDERLRLGMTAETSLVVNMRQDVLVVPYDCLTTDEYGYKCIYVSTGEKREVTDEDTSLSARIGRLFAGSSTSEEYITKKVIVQTGLETDYYTEVISDEIKEGDKVLVFDDSVSVDSPVIEEAEEEAEIEVSEPDVTAGAGGI